MIVGSDIRFHPSELKARHLGQVLRACRFTKADGVPMTVIQDGRRDGMLRIPRGAWSHFPDYITYEDNRLSPKAPVVDYHGELDGLGPNGQRFTGQLAAVERAIENQQGLVIAQPGWGKTNVALYLVAKLGTPTIVFVHTKDILDQWIDRAKSLCPDLTIGEIASGRWRFGNLTVAMVQTVTRDVERFKDKWAHRYGMVIVDEAHHSPALSWEVILNQTPAKYRFGFTASKSRADGMHPLMKLLIGPIIYEQKLEAKVPVRIIPVKTNFRYPYRGTFDWHPLLAELVSNDQRNQMIADRVSLQSSRGRACLVLSSNIKHLNNIHDKMSEEARESAVILTSSVSRVKRKATLDKFRKGEVKVVFATQLADEALDVPVISRVFLVYPSKDESKLVQKIGRGLREHPDKIDCVIYDFVDTKVSVLHKQFEQRRSTYRKHKFKMSGKEVEAYVTQDRRRREVQDRLRRRLGRSRLRAGRRGR